MKKLSIIIPCYNESQTIEELLGRVEDAILLPEWEKEIVIVDDGSYDGTREILKEYAGRMKVVFQPQNEGKGSAVRRGIKEASGDYVLIQDADLEYNPGEISDLITALEEGKGDIIYGSRNLGKHKRSGFLIPRLGVWTITRLLNTLYGTSLTDAWTCYKLFPRHAAGDFQAGRFESELLFTAMMARRGLKIAEVPISHDPRPVGKGKKIRYRDGIQAIFKLTRDRFKPLPPADEDTFLA
ncbi:MAG: glycosyltransferase family 2 protein [Candidatus Sungbacteria bacterium]|nr:glycosyltransferase family 2 protein [Candidatus Sungbacteria bacterium]